MELHSLISDLALILGLAGIISLLFKWLKQPVVLGYIVAGILAANFNRIFTIMDTENIAIWSEIGIVFLLFTLGLEFSFKKLLKVGGSAVISASVIIIGMMVSGFLVGLMFGWKPMTCIFLGAMLSMSSTTIIIKAFDDFGLKSQQFTTQVFGILIVEDLFAIVMLVLLNSLASSAHIETNVLFETIFNLVAFLVIWFVIGLYFIPIFLRKVRRFLNDETLLIVALALCFGMVVMADVAGFSAALGAFVMGSILAETVEGERIERITRPVKNLFGAIFFVSVGMMIKVEMLGMYWWPILVITLLVIVGQIFFATSGILISGQPLNMALKSAFSLGQIGEFAFIIATLGVSLNATDEFLYPIAVAVSVITTFTTPFIMRSADSAYGFLDKHLPLKVRYFIDNLSNTKMNNPQPSGWKKLLKEHLVDIVLHVIILAGVLPLYYNYASPLFDKYLPEPYNLLVEVVLLLVVLSPILFSLAFRRVNKPLTAELLASPDFKRAPLFAVWIFRIAVSLIFVGIIFIHYTSWWLGIILTAIFGLVALVGFSKQISKMVSRIELTFKENLNAKDASKQIVRDKLIYNVHLGTFEVSPNSSLVGRYFYKIDLRKEFGVSIVSIERGDNKIYLPSARDQLMPFDEIVAVGTDEQLSKFQRMVDGSSDSYKEVKSKEIHLSNLSVSVDSPFVGKTISSVHFDNEKTLVVAIQRMDGSLITPMADTRILVGDIISMVTV
ncbi:MAG: sodium:proton antiporter [Sphingobacteriia bacterium]|nr:sodium:proton antiporter [Sphingobacteriia bacterium]